MTTHVMVGAALAVTLTPNHPELAFVFGVLSHLLIDVIPHGDMDLYRSYLKRDHVRRAVAYVGIDAVIAIMLTIVILNQPLVEHTRAAASFGMIGGVLPDLMVGMEEYLGMKFLHPFYRLHFWFHNMISKKWDVPLWLGISAQVATMGAMFPLFR